VPSSDKADDRSGGYAGPRVAQRGQGIRTSWVWVTNGSLSRSAFAPPREIGPHTSVPQALASRVGDLDRIVDSFRIEALELDQFDPFTESLPDDEASSEDLMPPLVEAGAEQRFVEVKVLGPVEVVGWLSRPDRPVITELACYLALHRERPVSGESIRAALRPGSEGEHSAKTLRSYLSLLRKALGPDLMPSGTGAGYQLSPDVQCDWQRFRALTSMGEDSESLFEALALIRGQPFQAVPSGTFAWVFTEFLISDMEFAIAEVAGRAADGAVEAGELEHAVWALRQGLNGAGSDIGLWRRYLEASSIVGSAALTRARQEAFAALGPDAETLLSPA
jgi:hypothetical protein